MSRHKHSSPVLRPLVKFTVYAVVCLILLGALATRVGNLRSLPFVSHEHTYYAEMADASSLVPPDDVRIAGVTVGQVKRVWVRRGHAMVKFAVDRKLVLRQSTQVGMRFQNVIGAKYLYLYPGSAGGVVKPGWTFPIANNVGSADVGDFLTDVGAFLKALNPNDVNAFTESMVAALQDNDTQVNRLFTSTASVASTVGGLDTRVASVIDNLQRVIAALAARNSDLAAVADHLASVSQQLANRNDVLDNVISNFADVNRELNQMLGGNRANLDQTIANLQTIANVLAQHHRDLDQGLATLSSGLEPYTLISAYGQWFEIRVVYTCLARQTTCTYEQPTNQPSSLDNPPRTTGPTVAAGTPVPGTSLAPSPSLSPAPGRPATVGDIVGFALYGTAGR